MLDQINDMLEGLLQDERFASNMAKLMRKYFEALKTEGFTEEQALTIITSDSFKVGK